MGPNPPKNKNGGVQIPMPPKDLNKSRVEPVISKLAIIERFELLKYFLIIFDGPFNKKKCKAWVGVIEEDSLNLLAELTNRRNELTHDSEHALSSMKEAVAYFYQLRQLAPKLYECSSHQSPTDK